MELIKPVTSDDDLIKLADRIGVRIDNIFDAPEVTGPLPKRGSYIILLRKDGGVGHWTALHNGEYYDSMGENAPARFGVQKFNEFQHQSVYGEFCGIWALLFLYARQHNKPHLLKRGFDDLNITIL